MKTFKIVAATMVLGLMLTGRANATTAFSAPYADMTHNGSCLSWSMALPAPACESHATADADSGRVQLAASLPEGGTMPMQASSTSTGGVPIHYVLGAPADSIPFTVVAHVNSAHARIAGTVPGGANSVSTASLVAYLGYGFSAPLGGSGSAGTSTGHTLATTNSLDGVADVENVDVVFSGAFARLSGQFAPGNYDLFFGASGGVTCGVLVPDLCSGATSADVVIQSITVG